MKYRRYGKWTVILLGLLILAISSYGFQVEADDPSPDKFLILRWLYDFETLPALPYEVLGEMGWNAEQGFYELREAPQYLYTIVECHDCEFGYVMQDVTNGRCLVFWMFPEYGEDNQPHVKQANWIGCDNEPTG